MKIVITAREFTAPGIDGSHILIDAGYDVAEYCKGNYGVNTDADTMADLIGDADAAITGLEPINESVLKRCPNLKLISRRGIGYDSLKLDDLKKYGVSAVRTTGAVEGAVAEHVMAYIMHFARHISEQNSIMHKGKWERIMTYGAKNHTLGIIGFGGIGKETALRANGFGMRILYNCRHPQIEWESKYNAEYAALKDIMRQSDYISVCVPLTADTKELISRELINLMKKDAVLINTARSAVVDNDALADALKSRRIRGACIDVFDREPCTHSVFTDIENAVLTPHTASFTSENFKAMNERAARNVIDFFSNTIDERYIITKNRKDKL